MDFKDFSNAVELNTYTLINTHDDIFITDCNPDDLWEKYLSSFPEGTNNIFKERTEHDCNACKSFIRHFASIVFINDDYSISTIWENIDLPEDNFYKIVSNEMDKYVKQHKILSVFRYHQAHLGVKQNKSLVDDVVYTWHHLYFKLPRKYIISNDIALNKYINDLKADAHVFSRSLQEISSSAIKLCLEMLNQIYRGQTYKKSVELFNRLKNEYESIPDNKKENFIWYHAAKLKSALRFKNTSIGTFLCDLTDGVDINVAVEKYESKVAPLNYKRSKSIITKSMIKNAQKKIADLGLTHSLNRRHANNTDLSVKDILYVDRSIKNNLKDVFDELLDDLPDTKRITDNLVNQINIDDFMTDVIPKASLIELYFDSTHIPNLINITAADDMTSPILFRWNNHFAWSYNGDAADSLIKQRVKKAGGNIDASIRCSLAWENIDDLDIHIKEPDGNVIFWNAKRSLSTGGVLDIDQNASYPYNESAVENIVYPDSDKLLDGTYTIYVHNFHKRTAANPGFAVEVAFDNQLLHTLVYNENVKHNQKIKVAEFNYNKRTREIKFTKYLDNKQKIEKHWNINTLQFHKVEMMMLSPNYWHNANPYNEHKHYIFILENCKNPENCRGFYNEFLKPELFEHRKVFEILADKLKIPYADEQLAGLGFSETISKNIMIRATIDNKTKLFNVAVGKKGE